MRPPIRGHALKLACALLTLAALTACGETIRPQVLVQIGADPVVQARATWMRVRVLDTDGAPLLEETYPLQGDGSVSLPLSVTPIAATGDDPSRRFTIASELFDGDSAPSEGATGFSALLARSTFVDGAVAYLRLTHGESCADFGGCAENQTCHQGRCVGACVTPVTDADISRTPPSCTECESCSERASCDALAVGTACGCADQCDGAGTCMTAGIVQGVACGSLHTCTRNGDRELFCFGNNEDGQLGQDGPGGPTPVRALVGAQTHDAGRGFTCAINADTRRASCWGDGRSRRLGVESFDSRSEPREIDSRETLEELALGNTFGCGRSGSGDVICWGRCVAGQLGPDGGSGDMCAPGTARTPVRVVLPAPAVQISAGHAHACARLDNADIYCWGENGDGRVGDLTGADIQPVPLRQEFAGSEAGFMDLSNGAFSTCAITTGHELWCWGGSSRGNVGIGSFGERVRGQVSPGRFFADVECGGSHCCAIERDTRSLYCWGGNESRQVGGASSADTLPEPVPVAPGMRWLTLDLGDSHGCAVEEAGAELWCWGSNTEGQLGLDAETIVGQPRRICGG